jgi:TM2 domain-containing membrane protein YozV
MRDPFTAGLLSFIIPGVGQFYNGRILAGILWLIVTPGLWIGSGGTLGWICHIIAAYTAYSYAKDHPVRYWKPPPSRSGKLKRIKERKDRQECLSYYFLGARGFFIRTHGARDVAVVNWILGVLR